jgi:hypothetical protein
MTDVESLIVSELERMLPLPNGSRADWSDVVSRSGPRGRGERWRWRRVIVAAVVAAALVVAGIAIAAGFGAFNGISAAQHPRTAADKLRGIAKVIVRLPSKRLGIEPDNSRLVTQLADGIRIYAIPTSTGHLCVLAERVPRKNRGGVAFGCLPSLTQSKPSTVGLFRATGWPRSVDWGIALDSVAAVSFVAGGREVTVPVTNNVWAYEGQAPRHGLVTAHFKDGSTKTIQW